MTLPLSSLPTVASLYREAGRVFGDGGGFSERKGKTWTRLSPGGMAASGSRIAAALIARGFPAGGFVGLFADSGIGWLRANFGIQMAGGVDVPRGTEVTADEMRYIVRHAGLRWIILGDQRAAETWAVVAGEFPGVELVASIRTEPADGIVSLDDLEAEGEAIAGSSGLAEVDARIDAVRPDDLFTLIYTSGTTGIPKGVQLTHRSMMSQVRHLPFAFGPEERFLSILPVWHIYERVFETIAVSCGSSTWFTGLKTIRNDLAEIRPTMMASAPRLWEGLYNAIRRQVESAPPTRRALFRLAMRSARRVREGREAFAGKLEDVDGRILVRTRARKVVRGWLARPFAAVLDPLVLRKVRAACGGALRGTVSGGGALPPEVDRFFNDIGIPVCEGYGLTETCPVVAVRRFENLVLGTVGPLWPETEVRIVCLETGRILYPDDSDPGGGRGRRGEIIVRGPQVMRGYYRDPETTAKVLSPDGWFRTGDLGLMTFNDCLKILGRVKETIVLMSGENVEPVPIENRLSESPWIEQCIVLGQDRKFLAVLIVPSVEDFRRAGLPVESYADCAKDESVRERVGATIRTQVSEANGFKPFEQVRRFHLLDRPFEVGEELTRTFKLRRHIIEKKHRETIDSLFQSAP